MIAVLRLAVGFVRRLAEVLDEQAGYAELVEAEEALERAARERSLT